MGNKKVGNFRSNLFGGFKREDVIAYIKTLHDKLAELEADNAALEDKLHSLGVSPSIDLPNRNTDPSEDILAGEKGSDTSGDDAITRSLGAEYPEPPPADVQPAPEETTARETTAPETARPTARSVRIIESKPMQKSDTVIAVKSIRKPAPASGKKVKITKGEKH